MHSTVLSQQTSKSVAYDPFVRGRFPVGVRTIQAMDPARDRLFPCEIWYPAAAQYAGQDLAEGTQDSFAVPAAPPWRPRDTQRSQTAVRNAAAHPGTYPLILFSHHSGGHRRAATFLHTHLSSHGYVVAALDHSEVVAAELKGKDGETAGQLAARAEAWVANRVPDIRFLLDQLVSSVEANVDPAQIGIVGHSFGGWTVLAAPDVETRIGAVVALAPAGSSNPKPGIIRAQLAFRWGRDVPTLYLVAENDVPLPLAGMYELFERTPVTKQMVILRRADHGHFLDHVEEEHENARKMLLERKDLAWMAEGMRPIAELCSGEQAHLFVRGLTLCHMDAVLKRREDAKRFSAGDIEAELAARGVDVLAHK
jgi:dienelactone hydrolase